MKNYCDIKDPKDITTKEFVEQTITPVETKIDNHIANETNPHKVTAEQVDAYDKKQINNGLFEEVPVTVSGTAVSTDMVSPVEHEVECRVSNNNIINPAKFKASGEAESAGVFVTNNGDGSITLDTKGLPCSKAATAFTLIPSNDTIDIELTTYTLSCEGIASAPKGLSVYIQTRYYKRSWVVDSKKPVATDPVPSNATLRIYGWIEVEEGTIINNVTLKPMFQKGSVATPYTPYVPDLSVVTVSRYGSNLFDNQKTPTTKFNSELMLTETGISIKKTIDSRGAYVSWEFNLSAGIYWLNLKHSSNTESKGTVLCKLSDGSFQNIYVNGVFNPIILSKQETIQLLFYVNKGMPGATTDVDNYEDLILSLNEQQPYSSYIQPNFYNVHKDGVVFDISSISPNMTILTNNSNVLIEATYNADVSKYTVNQPLTPEQMLKAEKLKFLKVDDKVIEVTKKYSIPRTEGTDGQFALSDGKGGIRFETFINRAEVGL